MALTDQRLRKKLNDYLAKFAKEWTFERLANLGDTVHNEYEHGSEPTHPDFVQVHLEVLERVTEPGKDYFQVSVDISDNRRGFGKGSAYQSLCGGMCVHSDGKTEIFIPKEAENNEV
ncbi:MAG: hypothetical protein IV085_09925 [Thiobacillus sp.]|nr:hypothetical protein [Thiobacillus sp.]